MGTFDFLSGMSGSNANQIAGVNAQQYQQLWNTGSPQGMDYSQVLGGGQTSPATQGLDFNKIGQWALERSQYAGQSPQAGVPQVPMSGVPGGQDQPWALPQQAPGLPRGNTQIPDNQAPGYIGRGSRYGLLGGVR